MAISVRKGKDGASSKYAALQRHRFPLGIVLLVLLIGNQIQDGRQISSSPFAVISDFSSYMFALTEQNVGAYAAGKSEPQDLSTNE